MSNAQISRIETRAQRIVSKVNALGFTKNGMPMVIDQARELVASEEGYRNWHAMRAAVASVSPKASKPVRPSTEPAPKVGSLTTAQSMEADEQGWNLFEAHGGVIELQIQRDDELEKFESDDEAWLFVIAEAERNPSSAAAAALQLLREHSPAEYRRVELFDRENGQRLPKRPCSTAGHLVDLAEVATWVSIHDKEDFAAASPNRQQWFIDRFVLAHGEEDRFATYLTCEAWTHIFVGKSDSMTRWVYRLGSRHEGVVAAQIEQNGRWVDLDRVACADLKESIDDNGIPEDFHITWVDEVKLQFELPYWAR